MQPIEGYFPPLHAPPHPPKFGIACLEPTLNHICFGFFIILLDSS